MMKKTLAMITVLAILLMLSTTVLAAAPTTKAIKGTPVIDGEIDEIWKDANVLVPEILALGNTLPEGKFKTMWDEDYIYILAEIQDSDLFEDATQRVFNTDSIYYQIEEDNDKGGALTEGVDKNNGVNFENRENEKYDFHKSAAKIVDGGYVLEISIAFTSIKGAVGKKVGFEVSINEANNTFGTRVAMAHWADITDTSWKDTSVYGTLEMVAAPVKAASTPKPTTNTSGNANTSSGSTDTQNNTGSNPDTVDAGTLMFTILGGVSGLAAVRMIRQLKKA